MHRHRRWELITSMPPRRGQLKALMWQQLRAGVKEDPAPHSLVLSDGRRSDSRDVDGEECARRQDRRNVPDAKGID